MSVHVGKYNQTALSPHDSEVPAWFREKPWRGIFKRPREKKSSKKKKNTLQPSLQSVTDDKVLPLPFPNMYTVSTQAFLSLFNFSRRNEMSNEQEIPPNMTMTELLNTGL